MPEIVIRILALALAGTFLWSAVAKLLRFENWRAVLAGYRLPAPLELGARILVPATEVAVAAALLAGAVRLGAAASVLSLAAFSIAILRARALQGDKLPCGCFGKTKTRDYRFSLLRNGVLALVSGALLVRGEDGSPLAGFGAPEGSEAVAAASVLVGAALIAWMVWGVLRVGKEGSQGLGSEGVRK